MPPVRRRAGFTKAETFRFVDEVGFAFPFAWIFGRVACSLAHDPIGVSTTHWLGVRFPEGPRFDLGLLELLYTIILAALWLLLDGRRLLSGPFLHAL